MSSADEIDSFLAQARLFYSRCILFAPDLDAEKSREELGEDSSEEARIGYISALYSDGSSLLLARGQLVSDEYLKQRNQAKQYNVLNVDRPEKAVIDSFAAIKSEIVNSVEKLTGYLVSEPKLPLAEQKIKCPVQWENIAQRSGLLMEEITFLSKRIDEIAAMEISLSTQASTAVSLRYSVIGLFIAAFGLLCAAAGVLIPIFSARDPAPAAIQHNLDALTADGGFFDVTGANLHTADTKLSRILSAVKELKNQTGISDQIKGLSQQLHDIKAVLDTLNNRNLQADAAVAAKADILLHALAALESSVDSLPKTPQDTKAISALLVEIKDEIREVKAAIGSQKLPESKPPITKKAVINFGE